MGADRSTWLFPRNEADKLIGWKSNGKGLENKDPLDIFAGIGVDPYMFGAIGDGVADDTNAIRAAIQSGLPLDWGGPEDVYRITESIDETLTSRIMWRGAGARILFDPASPTQFCIRLLVGVSTHKISGVLEIDANEKAFQGIRVENAPGTLGAVPFGLPDFIAEDLRAKNVYRSSTSFTGGDGIYIIGGWRKVSLLRPWATDCKMAVGAGLAGSQGIFGITVCDDNAGNSPQNVTIIDPYIDTIFSEDNAYYSDQDAIRVFSDYNDDVDGDPLESSFLVIGGTIRNCRNRSIKCQMQNGRVIGTKLVKTADIDPGAAGTASQSDIDFQVGGGQVSGIEVYYKGYVPREIVNFTETTSTLKGTAKGIVSGISGVILGGSVLPRLVRVTTSDDVGKFSVAVSNIVLEGAVGELANLRIASGAQRRLTATFSDITVDLQTTGITFIGSVGQGARVFLTNVNNFYGSAVPLFSNAGGQTNRTVSAVNCTGFTDSSDVSPTASGAFTQVNAISPASATASGVIRPTSLSLADGATASLPDSGYSTGRLLFVSVGINNNTYHGLFAYSSNGAVALTPEATAFGVGGTTEPGSGLFRIWGSPTGPQISNRSGTSRQIFVVQVG